MAVSPCSSPTGWWRTSRVEVTRFSLQLGFAVTALGLAASACGDIGDENYVPPTRTAVNQIDLDNSPWCVGTCLPDYGSQRIDCNAEAGLEFFPYDVMNADAGTITQFYAYNDGTNDFMVAGPIPFDPAPVATNYEPQAVTVNDRCGPDGQLGMENVHHIRGGLFREWGGGMGRRLLDFVSTDCSRPAAEGEPDYCPDADPRIDGVTSDPSDDAYIQMSKATLANDFYGMMVDLRGWEGISFWARGGPNNTGGVRVGLGDRQLDDDVAFLENRAGLEPLCGRVRECGCRNHRPCTENDIPSANGVPTFSCWQPGIDPSPGELQAAGAAVSLLEDRPYDACGITACNEGAAAFAMGDTLTAAPDPLFATAEHPNMTFTQKTAQCLRYKLTNDLEDSFCYDPNNPATFPSDPPQQCGDVFAKGVTLTQDWQFFKIPFTELRQEGYAKPFGTLDLSKITLVRFTWSQGWVDVWLDDVRFYRHIGFTGQSQ